MVACARVLSAWLGSIGERVSPEMRVKRVRGKREPFPQLLKLLVFMLPRVLVYMTGLPANIAEGTFVGLFLLTVDEGSGVTLKAENRRVG